MDNQGKIKNYISALLGGDPADFESFQDADELLSAVKVFRSNEVLFHVLINAPEGFKADPRISSLIKKEEEVFERIFEHFLKVSDAFSRKGLRFFPMKSFRNYKYVDDDIDIILVEPQRKLDYLKALEEAGFAPEWNRSMLREPYKSFYVRRNAQGEELLPRIHAHLAVSWNGIRFFDSEKLYSRLRTIEVEGRSIPYPSLEDDLMIMAAHSVSENTYITAGEMLHLKGLVNSSEGLDTGYINETVREWNWGRGMKDFLGLLEESYRFLVGEDIFPLSLSKSLNLKENKGTIGRDILPPYFLRNTNLLSVYTEKFFKDLFSGKFGSLGREVVTFGLIIWLFRYKKSKKFKAA